MIGLSSMFLQKTWIHLLYRISTFWCTTTPLLRFFLKTWNFHCTWRSKNWEFQILQIIDFLKTTKMPECQDLLRLLVCASWSCIGVSCTYRDIENITFWFYIPPSPLKKDGSSKICWNLIFHSQFSCGFWELVELLMALKWRLWSSLSFRRII